MLQEWLISLAHDFSPSPQHTGCGCESRSVLSQQDWCAGEIKPCCHRHPVRRDERDTHAHISDIVSALIGKYKIKLLNFLRSKSAIFPIISHKDLAAPYPALLLLLIPLSVGHKVYLGFCSIKLGFSYHWGLILPVLGMYDPSWDQGDLGVLWLQPCSESSRYALNLRVK